jgi:hypothetical protein
LASPAGNRYIPPRFRALPVFTSSGTGTRDPPMCIDTHPEMVLLYFEKK